MRPIEEFEDFYSVDEFGKVYRIANIKCGEYYLFKQPKQLKWCNKGDNITVELRVKPIRKHYCISRLVYSHFIGEINDSDKIYHKDGNRLNNHYSNLVKLNDVSSKYQIDKYTLILQNNKLIDIVEKDIELLERIAMLLPCDVWNEDFRYMWNKEMHNREKIIKEIKN